MSIVIPTKQLRAFEREILGFYKKNGREFAWRKTSNPYHILVSEIMLQQTQVSRVTTKYPVFVKAFPTIESLAKASLSDVLSVWSGLGYNRRARTLRSIAIEIVTHHKKKIPKDYSKLISLPGIGQSTAGALLAFAYNIPSTFIETNIRRAFIYHFAKGKSAVSDKELIPLIKNCAHHVASPRIWYWALMDYGSYLVKVVANPNHQSKHHKKQKTFHGSNRQVRGELLRVLLAKKKITKKEIALLLRNYSLKKIDENLDTLKREGMLMYTRGSYMLTK